jgi:hypothetical protein
MAGLGGYLSTVGLDKADKLAGVLSLLVAVVALVAPYLVLSDQPSSEPSPVQVVPLGSTQSVVRSLVGGHLTQARDVGGIRVPGEATSATPPTAESPAAGLAPDASGGQYVNGVWVGGNLTQVDGVDGDVTLG